MKLLFKKLQKNEPLQRVIIHSLSPSLYQISVQVDGAECLLWEDEETPVRGKNLSDMRRKMNKFTINDLVVRQERDYEEMIGQPPEANDETMEVPLGAHTEN